MCALFFLCVDTILISIKWYIFSFSNRFQTKWEAQTKWKNIHKRTENYGNSEVNIKDTFWNGIVALKNTKVFALGCVQSLFEASMYTFVFMWTPVLQTGLLEIDFVENLI